MYAQVRCVRAGPLPCHWGKASNDFSVLTPLPPLLLPQPSKARLIKLRLDEVTSRSKRAFAPTPLVDCTNLFNQSYVVSHVAEPIIFDSSTLCTDLHLNIVSPDKDLSQIIADSVNPSSSSFSSFHPPRSPAIPRPPALASSAAHVVRSKMLSGSPPKAKPPKLQSVQRHRSGPRPVLCHRSCQTDADPLLTPQAFFSLPMLWCYLLVATLAVTNLLHITGCLSIIPRVLMQPNLADLRDVTPSPPPPHPAHPPKNNHKRRGGNIKPHELNKVLIESNWFEF